MRFKILAVIALITLTSCGGGKTSALNGEEAPTDNPIIVVKIDDTNEAHPQAGIDKADVVYIEQVEGGLVRLAAIFSSDIPPAIGPVRSARISDIDLISQFGKVAFFYSGAQSKLLPVIRAANLHDLGAEHESPKLYYRDSTRFAPYNLLLSGSEIKNRIANLDVAKVSNIKWSFGDLTRKGSAISEVKVRWPAANYSAKWNGKSWNLFHNGNADLTSDGIQIAPSTFIIQKVIITNSIYKDKLGGITPSSVTVGEGTGWILRNGVAIKAIWNRPDASSGTTWNDIEGKEIKFAAGQVWIALTDQNPEFTAAPSKK